MHGVLSCLSWKELWSAAAHSVTAEHTEQRQELDRAPLKQDIDMRRSAFHLEVCSCPLSQLQTEAELAPERATVTSGGPERQLQVLNGAVSQLTSAYSETDAIQTRPVSLILASLQVKVPHDAPMVVLDFQG